MSIRIKFSYETDQEKDRVLKVLRPLLGEARVSNPKISKDARYKRVYIELKNLARGDP